MTATPLRDDNRDTYAYFGDPIYTYSLRQGIEDGFLAPYRVHRIVTDVDAAGWRPSQERKTASAMRFLMASIRPRISSGSLLCGLERRPLPATWLSS